MPVTIKLKHPVTEPDGTVIAEMTFRDPIAKDMMAFRIGDTTVGNWLPLITALSDVHRVAVDEMHFEDVLEAINALGPLLLPSPATGTE